MRGLWIYRCILAGSFVLALLSLVLIGWAVWQHAHIPYAGATWSLRTGIVDIVDHAGPAAGQLQPGDRVLTINNVPVLETRRSPIRRVGEVLHIDVDHAGARRAVVIRLTAPPLTVILRDSIPLLVAFSFWVLSIVVLTFTPKGMERWLTFLFGQVMSITLTTGAVSWFGPMWTTQLFDVLLWWFGPLAILFHLHFPTRVSGHLRRYPLLGLFGVALVGSLPELVSDPLVLRAQVPALYAVRLLWLAGCLFGVVLILVRLYRRTPSRTTRRRVGLVALGSATAFLPFLTLSLLPEVLLHQPLLPYEGSLLFLLFLPLTYGYAIFKYHLIAVDRYISRAAAALLVFTLLGGAYLLVHAGLLRLLPAPLWQQPATIFVLAVLLAVTAVPLHRHLQIVVNGLLYGGWYDYHSAVQHLSRALDSKADDTAFAQNLCTSVQVAMQLEWICLLLVDRDRELRPAGLAGRAYIAHGDGSVRLSPDSLLAGYFQKELQPIDGPTLCMRFDGETLSAAERQLLQCEQPSLWLPLADKEHLLGLLIVGPKRGSDDINSTDRDILEVVARQAGIAMQNIQMSAELRQRAADSERLHRQLLHARERERTRVARELHDEIVQGLIGLQYELAKARTRPGQEEDQLAEIQDYARYLIGQVRQMCADLRSPLLDTMGLVGAVRSLVRDIKATAGIEVELIVEGDETQPVPEDTAVCLFRFVQEALINVQRHAAAQQVEVCIALAPEEIWLSVTDDGQGFEIPRRLERLIDQQHFGLIGLRERLELVHGRLKAESIAGMGTRLHAWVPLAISPEVTDGGNTR